MANYRTPQQFIRTLKIVSNLRGYTYKARIDKRTGRLIDLRAGCRWWRSFAVAQQHYRGLGHDGLFQIAKWSDEEMASQLQRGNYETHARAFGARLEARKILQRLEDEIGAIKKRLKKKKR